MVHLRNLFIIFIALLSLNACQLWLPSLDKREHSFYLPTHANTRLAYAFNSIQQQNDSLQQIESLPTLSNIPDIQQGQLYLLDEPQEALAARAALIDQADQSLDIQYYIWRFDNSGKMLFQKLWQAAERGVRIRLLLDDNNTRKMDEVLKNLDQHHLIQIRLFNPFVNRSFRLLAYLTDFPRLNRRMHNKSLIADNFASIIGGRNIGDEYFNSHRDTSFADLDVLVKGEIVQDISADFDRYWNSDSSYPFAELVSDSHSSELPEENFLYSEVYSQEVYESDIYQHIAKGSLPFIASPMKLISDHPAKALNRHNETDMMSSLNQALEIPQKSLYLVSPYFVPTQTGMKILERLRQKEIDITVFTNSLRATDVAAVHSGYARYRKPLLNQNIKLYEFKSSQAVPKSKDKGLTGSSATSLHAKTFIVDRERLFIGSLNLDPRSAKLNTEMGLLVYSPQLAAQIEDNLNQHTMQTAYQVSLDENNKLQWTDPETGEVSRNEPEAGFWKRWLSRFLSVLPIERLL